MDAMKPAVRLAETSGAHHRTFKEAAMNRPTWMNIGSIATGKAAHGAMHKTISRRGLQ
ncbi:hypothetical protein FIBSPDRAFT_864418 [Athelia psychrophila]|uniref:Uncharacterized protein n=1 Tax=Athelia psychrophila TaxID=1759441 RepID=A0A166GGF7_9AGAM|nr:hypothetical protein FIBSPDRAFT_864418 [Fibularhizoctonia sp. CBS 109695]